MSRDPAFSIRKDISATSIGTDSLSSNVSLTGDTKIRDDKTSFSSLSTTHPINNYVDYGLTKNYYGLYNNYTMNVLKHFKENPPTNVIELTNADFVNGTKRITVSGYYKFTENIIFGPNKNLLNVTTVIGSLTTSDPVGTPAVSNPGTGVSTANPSVVDNFQPTATQLSYPLGAYSSNPAIAPFLNPFALGFFAAITIEADNVVIDLNGFELRQHALHYCFQRFFALIELNNSPFISGQGPGGGGGGGQGSKNQRSNIWVKNGCLGLSSHHGVHGNNVKNVILENLDIINYEVAGVNINGGETVLVRNVNCHGQNTEGVPKATLSHALFLRNFIRAVNVTGDSFPPAVNNNVLPFAPNGLSALPAGANAPYTTAASGGAPHYNLLTQEIIDEVYLPVLQGNPIPKYRPCRGQATTGPKGVDDAFVTPLQINTPLPAVGTSTITVDTATAQSALRVGHPWYIRAKDPTGLVNGGVNDEDFIEMGVVTGITSAVIFTSTPISQTLSDDSYIYQESVFFNPTGNGKGQVDANAYGMLFNQNGVAVNDFRTKNVFNLPVTTANPTGPNPNDNYNVVVHDCNINQVETTPVEVIAITNKALSAETLDAAPQKGVVGEVFRILECSGGSVGGVMMPQGNGSYQASSLNNAWLFVAKNWDNGDSTALSVRPITENLNPPLGKGGPSTDPPGGPGNYGYGTMNMPSVMANWAEAVLPTTNADDTGSLGNLLRGGSAHGGTGYSAGGPVTISRGNSDATVTITGVDGSGAITGVTLSGGGSGYAATDVGQAAVVAGGGGNGIVIITEVSGDAVTSISFSGTSNLGFINLHDSMFHIMKGNIPLFLDGPHAHKIKYVTITNSKNNGDPADTGPKTSSTQKLVAGTTDAYTDSYRVLNYNVQTELPIPTGNISTGSKYQGTTNRLITIASGVDVEISDCTLVNSDSKNGPNLGIDIREQSDKININNIYYTAPTPGIKSRSTLDDRIALLSTGASSGTPPGAGQPDAGTITKLNTTISTAMPPFTAGPPSTPGTFPIVPTPTPEPVILANAINVDNITISNPIINVSNVFYSNGFGLERGIKKG